MSNSPEDSTNPESSEQPKKRKKWPWIAGGIVMLLIIIGLLIPDDEKSDDNKATSSQTTSSAKKSPSADSAKKSDKPKKAKKKTNSKTKEPADSKRAKAARRITEKLAPLNTGGEYGLDCPKWKVDTEGTKYLAYVLTCEKSEIQVAAGDGESGTKVWVDNLDKNLKNEAVVYALIKKDVAIVSPDQGKINLIWDSLGASGKRKTLGSAPFSD